MTVEGSKVSLLKLFFLFFKIGVVTIGGGYVMIPLLQKEFVEKRKLLEMKEFCDVMAVAQAGPGGVAINSSTVVGYKVAGITGAVVATVGTIVPSFAIIVLLAVYLLQAQDSKLLEGFLYGARPAVVGLLVVAAYSLGKDVIEDKKGFVLAGAGLLAVVFFNVHPVIVIVLSGIFGYLFYRKKIQPAEEQCDAEGGKVKE